MWSEGGGASTNAGRSSRPSSGPTRGRCEGPLHGNYQWRLVQDAGALDDSGDFYWATNYISESPGRGPGCSSQACSFSVHACNPCRNWTLMKWKAGDPDQSMWRIGDERTTGGEQACDYHPGYVLGAFKKIVGVTKFRSSIPVEIQRTARRVPGPCVPPSRVGACRRRRASHPPTARQNQPALADQASRLPTRTPPVLATSILMVPSFRGWNGHPVCRFEQPSQRLDVGRLLRRSTCFSASLTGRSEATSRASRFCRSRRGWPVT